MTKTKEERARERAIARASRGGRFFDRLLPGWAKRVRLTRLSMGSPCGCVLGQLEGRGDLASVAPAEGGQYPYDRGKRRLGLSMRRVVSLGLHVGNDLSDSYDDLDDAWRAEIRARRERTS